MTVQMVHTFSLNFFLFENSFASSRNVVLCKRSKVWVLLLENDFENQNYRGLCHVNS